MALSWVMIMALAVPGDVKHAGRVVPLGCFLIVLLCEFITMAKPSDTMIASPEKPRNVQMLEQFTTVQAELKRSVYGVERRCRKVSLLGQNHSPPLAASTFDGFNKVMSVKLVISDPTNIFGSGRRSVVAFSTTHTDATPHGSAAFAPVQPPLPPHADCCGPNMVQKRESQDCHCVYPVRVELFLRNVSLTSTWSNEFLVELASQLNLRLTQFEMDNFYVVGSSAMNITMDITPHSGISFSADQVSAMNRSLRLHEVQIKPELVGDYEVLNFTWFKPLPSEAPTHALAPTYAQTVVDHKPKSSRDAIANAHLNGLTVVGICVGALVILFLLLLTASRSVHKKVPRSTSSETPKTISMDGASAEVSIPQPTSTRFIQYEELKMATNNFEPSSMLGEGGFGRVYKGVLSDGTAVAIKKLSSGGHQGDKEFLVEVEMLSRLHHRNLVKLIGYYSCRESSQNLLCYELVLNGSLESWLHGPLGANCPLDWATRMKIAVDAARGLAYLHEDSQPCVIHRDFKSSNILLENDFHAKVSDFGLAKLAPEGRGNFLSTRVMGTFGYVAPEYAMTGHLLVKSDVYSYGVVLLELLSGRKPVDMSQPSGQENLVTWARLIFRDKDRVELLADPKLGNSYPKDDFIRACTVAAACVAPEADQRPTMGEVVQSLKMVQRSAEIPEALPAAPAVTTYESDGISSIFSSGPFSGMSPFDNDRNSTRTAVFSEDLHEGR